MHTVGGNRSGNSRADPAGDRWLERAAFFPTDLRHGMQRVSLTARHVCARGGTSTVLSRPFVSVAMASQDELKKQAGYKAVDDYVRSGMKVGLGTGSTAYFAVERVGQLLASGELTDIIAVSALACMCLRCVLRVSRSLARILGGS